MTPVCCVCLCTASCSEWDVELDGAFYILLPLIHFEEILKASLPSTDENLSCSSGIEVQCFRITEMGFVTTHGEDKTVYVCGQTWRGTGANMIEEINFVGFCFGC